MAPGRSESKHNEAKIIAKSFLASAPTCPDFSLIDHLCRLSFHDHKDVASKATTAIFFIIESLCDDFSDFGVSLSSEVLTRILQFIRTTPMGDELDRLLNNFGFTSSEEMLQRYKTISHQKPLSASDKKKVKKILILSRVTAGADIAITGVIIKRLSQSFPAANLVLIGPSHLREMFGSTPNSCYLTFIYKNDGTLFEKMTSWPKLLTIIEKESLSYQPGEVLLFDPDSRLSQLGLLPLIDDQYTFNFPSRVCQPENLQAKNLSFLANHWLNKVLSEDKTIYPKLSFTAGKASLFTKFYNTLKRGGCEFVVTINFGVGNNPAKKLSGHFEEALLDTLLQTPNTVVVLDTGRGSNELQRVKHLLSVFKNKNIATTQITTKSITTVQDIFTHGLVAFKGPLGALGEMIDATDCFIGYDSCGQHLANATRTPAVILFAGAPTTRFIHRWAPTNKENVTIPVNTDSRYNDASLLPLLKNVETAVNKIRSRSIVSD